MFNRLMTNLDFQGQALVLRAHRQQVLASNIANADTPGYVAKEFDFKKALSMTQSANGVGEMNGASPVSNERHIPTGGRGGAGLDSDLYALSSQPSVDNNSVDMDRERASFAENALHYEATLRFINSHVKTMLSAIQGQ